MKLNYESPIIKKLNAGMMNKFGSRTEYTPVKFIDNVAVADLMNKYGSPLFRYQRKNNPTKLPESVESF